MGIPHRCPVCKGKKTVKKGFYPEKPESTTCETCWGQGIVWDNSITTTYYIPAKPVDPNYYQWGTYQWQQVQCSNCKQWHMLGDGHSCTVSFAGIRHTVSENE